MFAMGKKMVEHALWEEVYEPPFRGYDEALLNVLLWS
jgi:hypothetical protein